MEMRHLEKITPEFFDSERINHHVHQAVINTVDWLCEKSSVTFHLN